MRSKSVQSSKSSRQTDLKGILRYGVLEDKYDDSQFRVNCQCLICQQKTGNKKYPYQPNINYDQCKEKMKFFLECLSKTKNNKGYKVEILQTCFYQNGKPDRLFINGDRSIEQLTLKKKTSAEVFNVLMESSHRIVQKWDQRSMSQMFARSLHMFVQVPVIHEKFISKVIPTHLQYNSNTTNLTRYVSVHNDKKFLAPIDQNKRMQNVSIVYFSDRSYCILNQLKLRQLLLTQNNGNLPHIMIITAYIQSKSKSKKLYSHYSKSNQSIKQSYLYIMACRILQVEMGILGRLDEQYPTPQEVQNLKKQIKQSPQKNIDYQTYRIVAYLQRQVNINTKQLIIRWTLGVDDIYYLCFIYDFDYQYRFKQEGFKRNSDLINLELQKTLWKSWQYCKQIKSLQRQKRAVNVNKSEFVFKQLFPDGDFESLIKYKRKSLIKTHRTNKLSQRNTFDSFLSKQKQHFTPLKNLVKLQIEKSTRTKSTASKSLSRNILSSRNMSMISRDLSFSISPKKKNK